MSRKPCRINGQDKEEDSYVRLCRQLWQGYGCALSDATDVEASGSSDALKNLKTRVTTAAMTTFCVQKEKETVHTQCDSVRTMAITGLTPLKMTQQHHVVALS